MPDPCHAWHGCRISLPSPYPPAFPFLTVGTTAWSPESAKCYSYSSCSDDPALAPLGRGAGTAMAEANLGSSGVWSRLGLQICIHTVYSGWPKPSHPLGLTGRDVKDPGDWGAGLVSLGPACLVCPGQNAPLRDRCGWWVGGRVSECLVFGDREVLCDWRRGSQHGGVKVSSYRWFASS